MQKTWHLLVGALLVAAYFVGLPPAAWQQPPGFLVSQDEGAPPTSWHTDTLWAAAQAVTAPTLLALPDGHLQALRVAADGSLRARVFNPDTGRWSGSATLVDVATLRRDLGLRVSPRPPVVAVEERGSLRLYLIAHTPAGDRLLRGESAGSGTHWDFADGGPLSPLPRRAVRLQDAPVRFENAGVGLRMAEPSPRLLRFSREGSLVGSLPLPGSACDLLLPQGPRNAGLIGRQGGKPVFRVTADGGRHWSAPQAADLPTAGACPSALVLGSDHWLLALGPAVSGQPPVRLMETRDGGRHWRPRALPDLPPAKQVPPPFPPRLVMADDGGLHLLYADGKGAVIHLWQPGEAQ